MPSQNQEKRRLASRDVPVKRLRVSRACDQCRSAREKCDGNQPSCTPCLDTKRACTYTSNPKKRGLQPGYIRSLEMTLAFIFQNYAEVEASVHDQLAQENTVLLARGTKESGRLYKSWTKTRFCKDVTKALSGEQIEATNHRLPSSDEESEVDVEDASFLRTTPDNHPHHLDSWAGSADCGVPEMSALSLPSHSLNRQPSIGPPSLTQLPSHHWKLIEMYCTYTQCWLPISDKLDIVKLSYSYPEQGLALSCDMQDSGSHAEMWSTLAVGAFQDSSKRVQENEPGSTISPEKLYEITRQLIPSELGAFELGHVKALLNLAVFNMGRSLPKAAWRLVGAASRIYLTLEPLADATSRRRNNVLSGCFLLESLLSLHLKHLPYIDKSDLASMGKIEEDGMEEWQPWGGHIAVGPMPGTSFPTLALSSFNAILELVDILASTVREPTARNFLHEAIGRLELWKSSLPAKLDYIRNESVSTPNTPPGLLLQLTYLVTAFTLVPSQAWLQRILDMLDSLKGQLGFARMPPVVFCLSQIIRRCASNSTLDQGTKDRACQQFSIFEKEYSMALTGPVVDAQGIPSALEDISAIIPGTTQLSPEALSSQIGASIKEGFQQPEYPTSFVRNLFSGINSGQHTQNTQSLDFNAFNVAMAGAMPDFNDSYNELVSGDLGTFIDDFASEHGVRKLQDQPHFMENLGFSSEVSMADVIAADPGRFMPTSSQLGSGTNEDSTQFMFDTFYRAG